MSEASPPRSLDLDAYFARIGYDGPRAPTLEVLRALHALHPATIPFENLDPRFGVTPVLTLDVLQAKLVGQRRGGYCFEHNTLFAAVLQALGFEVLSLIAQVRWQMADDALANGRTHKLLRVMIDGEAWLADVGFGSATLTAPLRMGERGPQGTPHGPVRLIDRPGGDIEQQFNLAGHWAPAYRFALTAMADADFEIANWYCATFPQSRFIENLIAARALPDRRAALMNSKLTIRHLDGRTERRVLISVEELADALRGEFGIEPPAWADLDAVVAKGA